eukprot:TCONS_00011719-protein
MEKMDIRPASTPKSQKVFYGVGHILNDLCANCWFSYVLLYWTKIVGLSETDAGLLLLIGQVADAVSTIFIGYACDRTKFRWYGKRKLWHLIGCACVLVSFPFIFNVCLSCEDASETSKMFYYATFVILFQFGWASTENSHLALIPEIAKRTSDIVQLNAIRSGFFFICGIFVYGLTWILLGGAEGVEVDPSLAPQFKYLSLVVVAVGFFFVTIFHFGTKEEKYCPPSSHDLESADTNSEGSTTTNKDKIKTWKDWLRDSRFYKTGLLYMCTRLSINIFQSFLVLYLTDALHFQKEAIAYFPLIVLICGVVTSSFMQKITKQIGYQLTYVIGASLMVAGSVWLFVVTKEARQSVYGAVSVVGISISIMLVTALAKTAELIGKNKESGAFVYSCMSFLDKLSTGLVIFAIQVLKPTAENRYQCSDCEWFSKITQSVVPGGFAMIGFLAMVLLFPSEYTCLRKISNDLKPSVSRSNIISNPSNEYEKQSQEYQTKNPSDMDIYYSTETEDRINNHFDETVKNVSLGMQQTSLDIPPTEKNQKFDNC